MNINELFPSKFVAAHELLSQDVTVQIARVTQEEVGEDREKRPILYFSGMNKGMVLNKTNAKRIAGLYGVDTNHWIGKSITLYPSETEYAGETVPCIRVRQSMAAGYALTSTAAPAVALPEPARAALPPAIAPAAAAPVINGGPRF